MALCTLDARTLGEICIRIADSTVDELTTKRKENTQFPVRAALKVKSSGTSSSAFCRFGPALPLREALRHPLKRFPVCLVTPPVVAVVEVD